MILDKNGKAIIQHNGKWLSDQIGEGTKIWHPELVNLYGDYQIGKNCNIGAFVEIGPGVFIGDNVTIGAHCFIPSGVLIGDNVFIGPRVTFCNDKYPPSGREHWGITTVLQRVSIGAGSVILPGVTIEEGARIGAGSVVTSTVGKNKTVYGNPAREKGKDVMSAILRAIKKL